MAFTVQDFQDLIRLLAEHPEWRAELRRHVLSDELLELPALVRQLAEQLAALGGRVDQLAEAQAQTVQRLERLEAGLVRLEAAIERLAEAPGRTETRVGRVEGEVLELRYARRLRVVGTGPLADLLDEAVGEQRLTEAEQEAVLAADLILTGRRREDDAEVYLLADISAGIGPHDVERAAERAATLQKLGRPVLPIVAGWRIDAEAVELAGERGVWHALDGQVFPPRGS